MSATISNPILACVQKKLKTTIINGRLIRQNKRWLAHAPGLKRGIEENIPDYTIVWGNRISKGVAPAGLA